MRFNPEEFWDEILYLVPKGAELFDSDAIPYYIDEGDGLPLRETYAHYAPYDRDVYQTNEPYEESIKYIEEYAREEKLRILARQAEEDRLKTKESMLRQIKAGMSKIHRR